MAELRIDHSIECDECGVKETADLTITTTAGARKDFRESGWVLRGDVQLCPACVMGDE